MDGGRDDKREERAEGARERGSEGERKAYDTMMKSVHTHTKREREGEGVAEGMSE
jgi:hypothetical protein